MTPLHDAVNLIGEARAELLISGDPVGAARLAELARLLDEEAEYRDGVEVHALPVVEAWYPPGATIGWMVRHDPATRRLRELRGLPLPGDAEGNHADRS